ncbi:MULTISPECIES: D-alanyl-lipoteichoic acid biosynthesis protein DltB [Paraclostridium]|uniref:Teichoic acid D-alanyltransferase n=3 Tax=Paraclostridium TaxID=1849822 RepID=A0A1X2JH41_PARBF|nr:MULTISPECIES: D-alanyl-lipoteichoic acid biosynthesis protein DltB [Paraclostridium]KGJ50706.1 alanyl transferase [Clostridium sp. NCR]MDV8110434.1 D-alanyl-lipoteichoic acid biosynthesis protein DltB [Bacillus sp. BAU-SS-2023]EQK47353.1 D-alanyl-lipoteichoic acid biosynthesis protein DltB [[Clostridium] bifermentans ATCC 19299] [Paraclostridium bifermentans ATCC 19299]MBN8046477.1 D-alanyl-lipoteichoic acid biosynthesis protein DltB [Paraclostridium bifermentans]MBS5953566.1 D-alanyl-lipot
MTFSQYGDYFYLYILLLTAIPAVILGLREKNIKYYGMIATAFMILLIVGVNVRLSFLIAFMVLEIIVVKGYEYVRKKTDSKLVYRLFLLASMSPIIINKISPLTSFGAIGFIGISYLNFRTIQMVIEIYDGAIKEVKISTMLYFVLFFPTLSSGPIDRSRRFEKDLEKKIPKEEYIDDYLIPGIKKIFMGVGYKFVIAFLVNTYWMSKIPSEINFVNAMSYMYAYSLYLFFDFGGYSLFAVGTSYIFGIKAPDNFDKPFLSKDMKEFWTRWHISLSRWFGDYIFSRFVIASMRKKRFKKRATASHVAQMITMITMGFWHGLTWFYIVYGIYQGVVLVLTDMYQKKSKFYKQHKKDKWFEIVQIVITFHIACFGLLIFSGYFA